MALSSAAVVAVYTAGFLRTKPAAARLEAASQRRFPAPVQATVSEAPLPAAAPSAGAAPGLSSDETPSRAVSLALPTVPRPQSSETAPVSSSAATARPNVPASAVSAESPAASGVSAAAADAQPSAPASPVGAAPAPVAASSLSGVPASGERSVADALAALPPVVAAAPRFKDGTYSGWGSCRHGDLEATITIEGGRIVGARISQCLTRYSCSWISPLPPQVIARQSENVDYVSGATQSATAFYDAVAEALRKAK